MYWTDIGLGKCMKGWDLPKLVMAAIPLFKVTYIIIVQTCGKRRDLPKFVDVLSVNLVARLLICTVNIFVYTYLEL